MDSLRQLIERVEALEGPSREVDAEIATTVDGYVYEKRGRDKQPWFYPAKGWRASLHPFGSGALLPRYTASLDAAIALCERLLPGNYREISGPRKYLNIPTPVPGKFRAELTTDAGLSSYRAIGWGPMEAISLVLATLRALEAQGGEE